MRAAFIKGRLQEATFPRPDVIVVVVMVLVVIIVAVVVIIVAVVVVVASDDPVYNGMLGPRGRATSLTPTQTIPFLHLAAFTSPSLTPATPRDSKRRLRD